MRNSFRNLRLLTIILAGQLFALSGRTAGTSRLDAMLARRILEAQRLDQVESMALNLLKGFNAGTSYGEIWIRDFNTFINGSLRVHPKEEVKDRLLLFFKVQGDDGNIPDGVIK